MEFNPSSPFLNKRTASPAQLIPLQPQKARSSFHWDSQEDDDDDVKAASTSSEVDPTPHPSFSAPHSDTRQDFWGHCISEEDATLQRVYRKTPELKPADDEDELLSLFTGAMIAAATERDPDSTDEKELESFDYPSVVESVSPGEREPQLTQNLVDFGFSTSHQDVNATTDGDINSHTKQLSLTPHTSGVQFDNDDNDTEVEVDVSQPLPGTSVPDDDGDFSALFFSMPASLIEPPQLSGDRKDHISSQSFIPEEA